MPTGKHDGRDFNRMYLGADTHPASFVGQLKDEEGQFSDTEISNYIKYNKPELFKKLNGLKIKGPDLPLAINNHHSVKDADQQWGGALRNSQPTFSVNNNGQTLRDRYVESAPQKPLASTGSFLRSVRTRVDQKLSNGYKLYRRRYNSREGLPACSLRLCPSHSNEYPAGEMLVVEYDLAKTTDHVPSNSTRNEYLCNPCFQRIFLGDSSRGSEMTRERNKALYFDGVDHREVDHCTVLESADRLYSPTALPLTQSSPVLTDSEGYVDHAFNYPSNSSRAKVLRAQAQQDIEQTLAEVIKYEKARDNELKNRVADSQHGSQYVKLLITRPYYMEPKSVRYKKQGLTETDYKRDLKSRKELIEKKDEIQSPVTAPALSPLKTIFEGDRICSCREPENGTEILRCSAELCPIGWFHLHCTGLDRMPTIREAFYCEYCRCSSDESGIEPLKDATSRHSSIDQDTYSPVRSRFRSTMRGGYLNHTLADWTAVNRAQFELEHSLERSIEHSPEKSVNSLDDGYLASDEFESVEDVDSRQPESDTLTPTSSSFRCRNSTPTPETHYDRCATPKPKRLTHPHTPPAPSTPAYISSKPWGTPININTPSMMRSFNISGPLSPSPTNTRKLDQIEDEMAEINLEITDNEDSEDEEGELVPLILER